MFFIHLLILNMNKRRIKLITKSFWTIKRIFASIYMLSHERAKGHTQICRIKRNKWKSEQYCCPLSSTFLPAHLLPAGRSFDVSEQCIYFWSYQRTGLSNTGGGMFLGWGPPLSRLVGRLPSVLHSSFYFIFPGFSGLMSVTATGNKMLVSICAVASQQRLWYIVGAICWRFLITPLLTACLLIGS